MHAILLCGVKTEIKASGMGQCFGVAFTTFIDQGAA